MQQDGQKKQSGPNPVVEDGDGPRSPAPVPSLEHLRARLMPLLNMPVEEADLLEWALKVSVLIPAPSIARNIHRARVAGVTGLNGFTLLIKSLEGIAPSASQKYCLFSAVLSR